MLVTDMRRPNYEPSDLNSPDVRDFMDSPAVKAMFEAKSRDHEAFMMGEAPGEETRSLGARATASVVSDTGGDNNDGVDPLSRAEQIQPDNN